MVLIIHHNDLDGWTAAKIIEAQTDRYGKIDLLPYNYGDKIPDTTEYDQIYVLDIPLPQDLNLEDVLHIDHHIGQISNKTILCESSVTRFCWKWFYGNIKNPHIDAIDDFDLNGPFGHSLAYGLGTSHFGWNKVFWDDLLAGNQYLFDVIKAAGNVLVDYLEYKESEQYIQAPKVNIQQFKIALLQGPIETLTSNYIAYQTKNSIMDFKIQHPNAPNLASFYGGSGHGNVGGFTKSLKEGLSLLQNWLS